MESSSKAFLALITGVCLVVTTAVLSMYYTQQYACTQRSHRVNMPDDSVEYLDRYYNEEKGVTAILGAGAGKCYILVNDKTPEVTGRPLRIAPEQLSSEVLRTIAGQRIVDFCQGFVAVPVEIATDEYLREKRQAPAVGRPGLANFDAQKVAQTQNRLKQNECQNEVLVDCGGQGGVYECVTGPGEVYRAKTQCETANKFSFNLNPRCKEFPKTERYRFIKCLQAFILGTHQN